MQRWQGFLTQVALAQTEAAGELLDQPQWQVDGVAEAPASRPDHNVLDGTLDAIRIQLDGLWALAQAHVAMPELAAEQVHVSLTDLYNELLNVTITCAACGAPHRWGFAGRDADDPAQGECEYANGSVESQLRSLPLPKP